MVSNMKTCLTTVQTSKMFDSVLSSICRHSNFIEHGQTRCPNGKMFGHQTMFDRVWSPNSSYLDMALYLTTKIFLPFFEPEVPLFCSKSCYFAMKFIARVLHVRLQGDDSVLKYVYIGLLCHGAIDTHYYRKTAYGLFNNYSMSARWI